MAQEKKIVKLSVVRNKKIKQLVQRASKELKIAIQDMPDDLDGWALVGYKRIVRPDGVSLMNVTKYSVLDPVDLGMLPQLVQMLLAEQIFKSSY